MTLDFGRPGKPTDDAMVENFNSGLRAECLSGNWFMSVSDAQDKLDAWRQDYNRSRPHSSLGNLTPEEHAQLQQKQYQPAEAGPILALTG